MKSFIISLGVFLIMLAGVIYYQYAVEAEIDEINDMINAAVSNTTNLGKIPVNKQLEQLKMTFSDMKKWVMLFEDHDKIFSMEECMENMMTYCDFSDTNAFLAELKKFQYLINTFSNSVKPTIENIL